MVKEPFIDAWNNLILLFEKVIWYKDSLIHYNSFYLLFNVLKLLIHSSSQVSLMILQNRSSPLKYVSSKICLDFLKPFLRIGEETKAQWEDDSSNCNKFEGKSNHFTKLWSLMVRRISFLFISSRYILDPFSFVLRFQLMWPCGSTRAPCW